jgi:hypothetical protein
MQSHNFGASFKRAMQALPLLVIAMVALTPAADAANSRLPRATTAHYGYTATAGTRNGLPATCTDSFVSNAMKAGRAEAIYGDEGVGDAPPPFYGGFTAEHRINAGITGQQDAGLTTGHGSRLPDAWGRDEYLGGQEWSQSGSNRGGYDLVSSPDIQVVASYDIPTTVPVPAPSYQVPPRRAYSTATAGGANYRTYSGSKVVNPADSGF